MKTRSSSWRTKTESEPTEWAGPAAVRMSATAHHSRKGERRKRSCREAKAIYFCFNVRLFSPNGIRKRNAGLCSARELRQRQLTADSRYALADYSSERNFKGAMVSGGAEQPALAQNSNECKAIQFTWLYFERIWTIACGLCHLS